MKDWIGQTEEDIKEAEHWKKYVETPLSKEERDSLRRKMNYKYRWKISKYRDQRSGVISPVKASKYYKSLLEG